MCNDLFIRIQMAFQRCQAEMIFCYLHEFILHFSTNVETVSDVKYWNSVFWRINTRIWQCGKIWLWVITWQVHMYWSLDNFNSNVMAASHKKSLKWTSVHYQKQYFSENKSAFIKFTISLSLGKKAKSPSLSLYKIAETLQIVNMWFTETLWDKIYCCSI